MSPWKAVAAGAAALGAIGIAILVSRRSDPGPSPGSGRVALIGDSYAVGLGPKLQKLLPDFRYEAHGGTGTAVWARRDVRACGQCGDWLTAFKPDLVLVSLGTNDGTTPNPANYQAIVRSLHGLGARVVWIEPPAGVQAAAAARPIIASLGVSTVPATTTPLAGDQVHPRDYGGWAQDVAEAVARA